MMDVFAYRPLTNGSFIVRNVSPQVKTIKIFNYPIPYGRARNLLRIPGIGEQDIRVSLLKGELQYKIMAQDIVIISSDVDLIQFNEAQKTFLTNAGISSGMQVAADQLSSSIIEQQDIVLNGNIDSSNTIFTIPTGFFVYLPPNYKIIVYLNGIKQAINNDYVLGSFDNGYRSIIMTFPPDPGDIITADYFLRRMS